MTKQTIDLEKTTQAMDALKQEEARLKFELKNVQDEMEKQQLILETALRYAKVDSMTYGIYSFGWKNITSRRFNQKKFSEDHPDLLEQYKTEITNSKFDFKVGI